MQGSARTWSTRRPVGTFRWSCLSRCWGPPNYTHADATRTQRRDDFIQSHTRAVKYLGGVSAVVVLDHLTPLARDDRDPANAGLGSRADPTDHSRAHPPSKTPAEGECL